MHSDDRFQYLASDNIVKGKSVNIIILQQLLARHVLVETDAHIAHYIVNIINHSVLRDYSSASAVCSLSASSLPTGTKPPPTNITPCSAAALCAAGRVRIL